MKTRTRTRTTVLAAAALLLAGCGSDTGTTLAAPPDPGPPVSYPISARIVLADTVFRGIEHSRTHGIPVTRPQSSPYSGVLTWQGGKWDDGTGRATVRLRDTLGATICCSTYEGGITWGRREFADTVHFHGSGSGWAVADLTDGNNMKAADSVRFRWSTLAVVSQWPATDTLTFFDWDRAVADPSGVRKLFFWGITAKNGTPPYSWGVFDTGPIISVIGAYHEEYPELASLHVAAGPRWFGVDTVQAFVVDAMGDTARTPKAIVPWSSLRTHQRPYGNNFSGQWRWTFLVAGGSDSVHVADVSFSNGSVADMEYVRRDDKTTNDTWDLVVATLEPGYVYQSDTIVFTVTDTAAMRMNPAVRSVQTTTWIDFSGAGARAVAPRALPAN